MTLDPKQLAKTRFGLIQSLDELFDGFLYCRTKMSADQGSWSIHPDGWYFCSGIDTFQRVITFPPGHPHPGPVLYTKPKPHVKQAVLDRSMEGKMGSFSLNTWKNHGMVLINATDSTSIPHIWLAFMPVEALPAINPDNTRIWTPGEPA